MQIIFETLWFYLPAMVANMAPVFVARYAFLPALARPLDGGLKFRGRRVFGSHKTVRGLVAGTVAGGLISALQYIGYGYVDWLQRISLVSYSDVAFVVALGAMLGMGALAGDAIKSFFKRQIGVKPGSMWPPFDQIDFVIGATVTTSWLVPISYQHFFLAMLLIGLGSLMTSVIGVALGIKESL